MSTLMRSSALAAALAGMLSLTGCDADQGEPADGTETAEQSPTAADETDDPEVPGDDEETEQSEMDFPEEDAEVVDQMTLERSVDWEDYEVISETELRFLATSGNQSCYGQRYQVEETEEEVAVAIIMGQREGAPEVCTQEAVFVALPVELDEPLGEREVVELENPELND